MKLSFDELSLIRDALMSDIIDIYFGDTPMCEATIKAGPAEALCDKVTGAMINHAVKSMAVLQMVIDEGS